MQNKKANIDIINPEDSSIAGMHMIGGGDFQTAQYASPQKDMTNDDRDGFELDFEIGNITDLDDETETKSEKAYYILFGALYKLPLKNEASSVNVGSFSLKNANNIYEEYKNAVENFFGKLEDDGFYIDKKTEVPMPGMVKTTHYSVSNDDPSFSGEVDFIVHIMKNPYQKAKGIINTSEWNSFDDKQKLSIMTRGFSRIYSKANYKNNILNKIAIGLTDVPSAGIPQNPGLSREHGDGEAIDMFGRPSEIVDTHPINNKYQSEKSVNNCNSSEEAYFSYLYDLNHDENIGILSDLKDTFYYSRAKMVKNELVKLAQAMENSKAVREVSELLSSMGWEKAANDEGGEESGWRAPEPLRGWAETALETALSPWASRNETPAETDETPADAAHQGDAATGPLRVQVEAPGPWAPGYAPIENPAVTDEEYWDAVKKHMNTPAEAPTAGSRQSWNDGGTGFARYYPNERAGRAMMDAWKKGKPEGSGSDVRSYMRWLKEQGISEYGQALKALRMATNKKKIDRPRPFRKSLDQIAKIYADRLHRYIVEAVPGTEFDVEEATIRVKDWMLDNLTLDQIVKLTSFTDGDQVQAIEELVPGAWEALKKAVATVGPPEAAEQKTGKKPATVETADGRRTVDLATPEGQKAFATSFIAKLRKDPRLIKVPGRVGEGRATARRVKWLLTRANMSSAELIEEIARRGGHMLSDEMAVDVIKQLVRETRRGNRATRRGNRAKDGVTTASSKRQDDILKVLGRK